MLAITTAAAIWMVSTNGFCAPLTPSLSPHHISLMRIEPPRPGNLYGLPRGPSEAHEVDLSADKPVTSTKRRRR